MTKSTPTHSPKRKVAPKLAKRFPLNILAVDDNSNNLELIKAQLEKLGYDPIDVSSGNEALATLITEPFDAIFLDIHMPGVDGLDVAEVIRERKRSGAVKHNTYICAVTADSRPDIAQCCNHIGCDRVLEKPLRMESLQETLVDAYWKLHAPE